MAATRRYFSSTAQRTTITGAINSSVTTIPIAAAVGFPSLYPYTMILDPDTTSEEVIEVTNRASLTLTVTRGVDGTTAASHSSGAYIQHGFSARDFNEANSMVVNGNGPHPFLLMGA